MPHMRLILEFLKMSDLNLKRRMKKMIKDIISSNESVLPNVKQMQALKENFPSCFSGDGSFDIERFKEYLSDKLTINNEGYELKFLGKNYARLLASVETTTVIVPDEEHNNKPENKDSQNVYISGDNLDGLKQLLKIHAHQAKYIYIEDVVELVSIEGKE